MKPKLVKSILARLPALVLAALGAAFVAGLPGGEQPFLAGVAVALAAASTAVAVFLLGEALLLLRGGAEGEEPAAAERRLLEQEKDRLVAALCEIEFDHAMGKMNEEDYQALVSTYEREVLQLIRAIDRDREVWRELAEAALSEHLRARGLLEEGR